MDKQITPFEKFLTDTPPEQAECLQNLYGPLFRPTWDHDQTLWLAEIVVAVGRKIQRGLGCMPEDGTFRATADAVATDPAFHAWLTEGLRRYRAIGKAQPTIDRPVARSLRCRSSANPAIPAAVYFSCFLNFTALQPRGDELLPGAAAGERHSGAEYIYAHPYLG